MKWSYFSSTCSEDQSGKLIFHQGETRMTNVLSKGKNYIALEMIEFQKATFGSDIEAIVTKIQNLLYQTDFSMNASGIKQHNVLGFTMSFSSDKLRNLNKTIYNSQEYQDFTNLVFKRLGIKVNLIIDEMLAAMLPFYINEHHVFLKDYFRGNVKIKDQQAVIRKSNNKKGFVNLHEAKVGGIFSEYKHDLYVNFVALFEQFKMTPGEITAVILHELGHAFTMYEYSDRTDSVNQVLANVVSELNKKDGKADLVYVFKEMEKVNKKVTEAEIDTIANGNKIIAGYTWFRMVFDTVKQQLLNSKYDETSSETVADNFASRFQYGRQLVIALDKLHSVSGSIEKSKAAIVIANMIDTIVTILMASVGIGLLATGSIGIGIFLCAYVFLCVLGSGEDYKDYTYDELKIRYARVRNDQIELLKQSKYKGDEVKSIIDSIRLLDTIIDETFQYRPVFNQISNILFSSNRKADNSMKEQQLLESLTFNDLFLKSAELKTV
jgi:hypothetical protein